MKKKLPKVGEFYHFWDDGKSSPSRHYICKCEQIITSEEAKNTMIKSVEYDFEKNENYYFLISLYDYWHDKEMPFHDWLFSEDTDFFVECSCPNYDENNLWFVRTKDGGWFSMDIQSWWQGGRLDVTGEIYESIIKEILDNPTWYNTDCIQEYENEKYEKD